MFDDAQLTRLQRMADQERHMAMLKENADNTVNGERLSQFYKANAYALEAAIRYIREHDREEADVAA